MTYTDLARILETAAPWATREALERLTSGPGPHELQEGHILAPAGPAAQAWIVLSGRLEGWCGNARSGDYRRGRLVGGSAALSGHRVDELVAVEPTRVLPIDASVLRAVLDEPTPLAEALLEQIASEAQVRAEGVGDALVRLTHQPFTGAQLPPPPYSTGHARVRVIAVEWPRRHLESELPPRMRPADRPALLVIARLQHLRPWQSAPVDGPEYTEAALLLPVEVLGADGNWTPGLYTPWAWPNNLMSLFAGREMFGLAKRYGNVYEFAGATPRAVVRVDGHHGTDIRFAHVRSVQDRAEDVRLLAQALTVRPFEGGSAWPVNRLRERLGPDQDQAQARQRYDSCTSDRDREQFEWPVERSDHADALRMLKTAVAHPELLAPMLQALPAPLRTHRLLAWQRQFRTRVEGQSATRAWDPGDFEKDAITDSRMELRTVEKLQWFELASGTDPLYLFHDRETLVLRPITSLGVRFRGVFVHHAGGVALDYTRAADLTVEECRRLSVTFSTPETPPRPLVPGPVDTHTLSPELFARLRTGVERRVGRGEAVFERGQGEGRLAWLVVEGQVDEWRGDAYLGRRRPGQLVGEVGHVEDLRYQRLTSALARTAAVLRAVPDTTLRAALADPASSAELKRHIAEHAESWTRHAAYDLDVATRQVFTDHNARFAPGPYTGWSEVFAIPCVRPTDGHIEMRMPPHLRWHEGLPGCLLLVSRLTDFKPTWAPDAPGISYTETGLLVPCQVQVDGRWAYRAYFPWLYPSNIMASFVGRELYGYPKRYANTRVEEDRLLLRVDGQNALDVPYRLGDTPSPAAWRDLVRLLGAGGMPYARLLHHNQSKARDLEWQRHVGGGPRRGLREGLLGLALWPQRFLRSAVFQGAMPWLPIAMAGWRRSFAPGAEIPEWALSGSAPWTPDAFDVDALVGSSFGVSEVDAVRFVHLEGRDLALSLPGERPRRLTPLNNGVRTAFRLQMDVGDDVLDYRAMPLEPKDRERLAYGPKARTRYGE